MELERRGARFDRVDASEEHADLSLGIDELPELGACAVSLRRVGRRQRRRADVDPSRSRPIPEETASRYSADGAGFDGSRQFFRRTRQSEVGDRGSDLAGSQDRGGGDVEGYVVAIRDTGDVAAERATFELGDRIRRVAERKRESERVDNRDPTAAGVGNHANAPEGFVIKRVRLKAEVVAPSVAAAAVLGADASGESDGSAHGANGVAGSSGDEDEVGHDGRAAARHNDGDFAICVRADRGKNEVLTSSANVAALDIDRSRCRDRPVTRVDLVPTSHVARIVCTGTDAVGGVKLARSVVNVEDASVEGVELVAIDAGPAGDRTVPRWNRDIDRLQGRAGRSRAENGVDASIARVGEVHAVKRGRGRIIRNAHDLGGTAALREARDRRSGAGQKLSLGHDDELNAVEAAREPEHVAGDHDRIVRESEAGIVEPERIGADRLLGIDAIAEPVTGRVSIVGDGNQKTTDFGSVILLEGDDEEALGDRIVEALRVEDKASSGDALEESSAVEVLLENLGAGLREEGDGDINDVYDVRRSDSNVGVGRAPASGIDGREILERLGRILQGGHRTDRQSVAFGGGRHRMIHLVSNFFFDQSSHFFDLGIELEGREDGSLRTDFGLEGLGCGLLRRGDAIVFGQVPLEVLGTG